MVPAPCKILNVGAGRGGASYILDKAGYDVTSLDLHPEHFQVPALHCEKVDCNEAISLADGVFDCVIAVEVIEHLENPWKFFREAVRVLRPNGLLIVTSPNVSNFVSRANFLFNGMFPYFRNESWEGCYHATPIFPWLMERFCQTTSARIENILYNRIDYPRNNDVLRHDDGKGLRRSILNLLPINKMTGEIACFSIRKAHNIKTVVPGVHYG